MAEHVSITSRDRYGRRLPRGGAAQAARIRTAAQSRLAVAGTDLERLAAAVDFLRAAHTAAGRGGVDRADDIDRVTRAAWAAGEQALRRIADREEGRDA